jgi:hypothetical protein
METHCPRKGVVVVLAAFFAFGDTMDVLDPGDGIGVVDAFLADVELLEEGLVDEAAAFLGCLLVADLGVVEQRQGLIERLHDLSGIVRGDCAPSLCLAALVFDSGLLGLENPAMACSTLVVWSLRWARRPWNAIRPSRAQSTRS